MAKEFSEMFPNGLNIVIALFEKAVKQIVETDEIEKIIRNAERAGHQDEADHIRYCRDAMAELKGKPFWHWHWIPILMMIESKDLLKDIITVMVSLDDIRIFDENEIGGGGFES